MFSNWYEIVILVILLLATGFAAAAWAKVKKALSETKDVLTVLVDALADDKISNQEIASIAKEVKECGLSWAEAFKALKELFAKAARRKESR